MSINFDTVCDIFLNRKLSYKFSINVVFLPFFHAAMLSSQRPLAVAKPWVSSCLLSRKSDFLTMRLNDSKYPQTSFDKNCFGSNLYLSIGNNRGSYKDKKLGIFQLQQSLNSQIMLNFCWTRELAVQTKLEFNRIVPDIACALYGGTSTDPTSKQYSTMSWVIEKKNELLIFWVITEPLESSNLDSETKLSRSWLEHAVDCWIYSSSKNSLSTWSDTWFSTRQIACSCNIPKMWESPFLFQNLFKILPNSHNYAPPPSQRAPSNHHKSSFPHPN